MRLRTRLSEELKARLTVLLPEAMETAWDNAAVLVVIEQLKFTPTGGIDNGWELSTKFEGVVRAELRANAIDALEVEPLIANLVAKPVFLNFVADADVGQLSERARIVLADWRDTIRDQDVASALRFTVSGLIAAYAGPVDRPEIVLSGALPIGLGDEAEYGPLDGGVG
jgi:hypothetical protein